MVGFGHQHHHFVETYGDPLGGSHPHRLDNLENCRADDNEDKEGNQLRTDRVFVISLGGLHNVSSLGHVLGVLLVGLSHLRGARHLGGCEVVGVDGDTSVD